jgi:hypothetical protein
MRLRPPTLGKPPPPTSHPRPKYNAAFRKREQFRQRLFFGGVTSDRTADYYRSVEPRKLSPAHPGEILLHDFIQPLGITQSALAQAIGVTPCE